MAQNGKWARKFFQAHNPHQKTKKMRIAKWNSFRGLYSRCYLSLAIRKMVPFTDWDCTRYGMIHTPYAVVRQHYSISGQSIIRMYTYKNQIAESKVYDKKKCFLVEPPKQVFYPCSSTTLVFPNLCHFSNCSLIFVELKSHM